MNTDQNWTAVTKKLDRYEWCRAEIIRCEKLQPELEALVDRLARSEGLSSRQVRDEFADAHTTLSLIPLKLEQLAEEMGKINAGLPELLSPLRTELVEFVDAERASAIEALARGIEKLISPHISAARIAGDASLAPSFIVGELGCKIYNRFDREVALAEIYGLATTTEDSQVGTARGMLTARAKRDIYRKFFKS